MRIVVVHNRYRSEQPSGEDMVVSQEIDLLREAGHHVERYQRDSDSIAASSVAVKLKTSLRVTWSAQDERAMRKVLSREPVDVVHVHNTFPLISASILTACHRTGVPVVATLHNFRHLCAAATLRRDGAPCRDCVKRMPWPAVIHRCYRDSALATLPLALSIGVHNGLRTWPRLVDRFIVMSRFALSEFSAAGWDREKFVLKPHFVPRPQDMRQGPGEYAMFLGRLSPEKGLDLLLRAWSAELGTLIIVGEGPDRRALEAMARVHGESVRFLGALSRSEAMRSVSRARVLVNPSRVYETFGLSTVEAFAHGVPAVVPNHGVFPEVVADGVHGALFVPGDAASLRAALIQMLDPDQSIRCGVNGLARYEERYSPEANLLMLESIYTDTIGRQRLRLGPGRS